MVGMTLCHYNKGMLVTECAECHEIVSVYDCDENGNPVSPVFDDEDEHECSFPENEEEMC